MLTTGLASPLGRLANPRRQFPRQLRGHQEGGAVEYPRLPLADSFDVASGLLNALICYMDSKYCSLPVCITKRTKEGHMGRSGVGVQRQAARIRKERKESLIAGTNRLQMCMSEGGEQQKITSCIVRMVGTAASALLCVSLPFSRPSSLHRAPLPAASSASRGRWRSPSVPACR